MISELDGFTFAEIPAEYEAELDQEEANDEGGEEESAPQTPIPAKNNTQPLHMPAIGGTHALA